MTLTLELAATVDNHLPSARIWGQAAPLVERMRAMPFNAELAAGTLSRESFRHYMIQDALYLVGYGRVLALAAAKAPDASEVLRFARAAETAVVVERALHGAYFERFGLTADDAEAAEPSPTCAAYVNFLLAEAATGSFASVVGALLPCFWVYRDIGLHVAARSVDGNFYQSWVDTYADPAFGEAVDGMIGVYDQAFAGAGPAERVRMERAFLACCRYEWMFWDAAYRCEDWPISCMIPSLG